MLRDCFASSGDPRVFDSQRFAGAGEYSLCGDPTYRRARTDSFSKRA
jgi:hypothetical protein